ncbi:tRNA 2-thiouridine(34) synthase MnmA [uncultured Thiothrix sp.]|jgi:tRNA-specific 2-thiouridylase|uniref:tRNA 2-thiouridine(34) synthase MnmA n=1 Tax=uncultured Thiothrix sp. TaxID=223185 RepID=UPI002627026A|nr:tRNA 2-thiouridine(34) synthase MnmA [uncultured Thiothrix sp.]HMT92664.1 tRNA 2-thiouridine(34) synthase MnmA [Thiolinea sp.]
MKQRVIVGLSGGVDSSVAALLLLEQGYQVEGLFMKNWEEDDTDEYCSATVDLADAQSVADQLGIRLHTVSFASEYWDYVFTYFLHEYQAGRTPNPDIMCNKEIKFKAFLDFALSMGADFIATGHYARIHHLKDGSTQMLKGVDDNKDQTYFLYTLQQVQLTHSLFPIGHLPKSRVRELAGEQGFSTARKKDSTGICFIGERKFRDFLQRFLPAQPGAIVSVDGTVLGEHHGLMYYTLGQRQGLGIGGRKATPEAPWFVIAKNLEQNELVVAQGNKNNFLLKSFLVTSQLHWVAGSAPDQSFECTARIRHRQPVQKCLVELSSYGIAKVCFEQAQRAITPGQSIVFYQGEVCLGGGIIDDIQTHCA